MKDRNYWLERGKKFSQKEGFICLGNGDGKEDLVTQERNFKGNLWMKCFDGFDSLPSYDGDTEQSIYYIETKTFNQIFPTKTKQEELDELLAKAEKLKQEIEEENKFKIGDILFAKDIFLEGDKNYSYIFKISEINEYGYRSKKYLSANEKGFFWMNLSGKFPFNEYKFTKIDL